MPDKESKKILKFPKRSNSDSPAPDGNKLLEIIKATQEKIDGLPTTSVEENESISSAVTVNINIHGGNNQFAPGHLSVVDSGSKSSPDKGRDEETFSDAINSAQKLQLRKLRDEIVKLSAECGFPKHPATIMSALNSTMGVRKYDQIVSDEFHLARAFLNNIKSVFAERLDFHKRKEELRRYMIQVVTETHRKNQPTGSVGLLGAMDSLAFSDLEKMYDVAITDLI